MQKVIINPGSGGTVSGNIYGNLIEKNYNLELSKAIYDKLKELGIDAYLVRDRDITLSNQDRLNIINNIINPSDTVIVLTNELNLGSDSGLEIIYSLRNTDTLARDLSNEIENTGQSVIKYYQLRDPNNTSEDFDQMIREPKTSENIIIRYGYINNSFDNSFLLNNIENLATAVSQAIQNYLKKENVYIVKAGDTLFSIATRLNVNVNDLKTINNLSSNALVIGQELLIPKNSPNQELSGEDEGMDMYINYTVKPGDSLYKIASSYNSSVDIIKDINNLESNTLAIGQILKIPTTTTSQEENYNNYIVKAGDSLYKIANQFNTTVNLIKDLNNLESNTLAIGQILKIPSTTGSNFTEENYTTYTVKPGDSLYKIATLFQTSISKIQDINNLTSNNLAINQVLKIPKEDNEISTNPNTNYTVKSGDSLYQIARRFNTTVEAIKALNNLTSNNLAINQVLKIPKEDNEISANPNTNYTVKSGDSLYQIARRFNTTVEAIKALNNLTSNNLAINQILKIPN